MADYEVEVLVRGRPVKVFKHKGDRFIEGRKGSSFELKITNNTYDRIEVVASVDGLSVINGEECGSDSEGYVVPAKESVVIPGWKLPDNKAAQFVFEDGKSSYSSQVGKGTTNVGVIGLMVFVEKEVEQQKPIIIPQPYPVPYPVPTPQPYPVPYPVPTPRPDPWAPWQPFPRASWRRYDDYTLNTTAGDPNFGKSITISSNNAIVGSSMKGSGIVNESDGAVSASDDILRSVSTSPTESLLVSNGATDAFGMTAMSASLEVDTSEMFEIGTGWGNEIDHNVTIIEFERRDRHNPDEMLAIFYDTRKGLEARGIEVIKTKKKRTKQLPNAFPTYNNGPSCEPPNGWKGKKR